MHATRVFQTVLLGAVSCALVLIPSAASADGDPLLVGKDNQASTATNLSTSSYLGLFISTTGPTALVARASGFDTFGARPLGVRGTAVGPGTGVAGDADSGGVGVAGTTPAGIGVFGLTGSSYGPPAASAGHVGVFGKLGETQPGSQAAGVAGESDSYNGYGSGVWGLHVIPVGSAPGVLGQTNSASANAIGVGGTVLSSSPGAGSAAVAGQNNGTNGNGFGVYGTHAGSGVGVGGQSAAGVGVLGYSGGAGVGVLGFNPSAGGLAGYFSGNVTVTGTLTKGAGAFRIDHPLDPAHTYLQHSFVESPDMKDVYDGVVATNARGFATVRLPAYFQALNKDFRYQLTIVGARGWRARVVKEIAHNRFTIQSDEPRVKVSWQVTGIRHDPYANAHRIQVVVPKLGRADGRYLHPGLYGQPKSKSVVPKAVRTAEAPTATRR